MADLFYPFRMRRSHDSWRVSAELGGLMIENQSIPWNSEAVIAEATLRLPAGFRRKEEFTLRVASRETAFPIQFRRDEGQDRCRVTFRVPTPAVNTSAELTWNDRTLSRVSLPILSRSAFLNSLEFHMPVVHARLGLESVACQAFVASQCKGLFASGLLRSPTSLAPLAELGVTVDFHGEYGKSPITVNVPLTASQLLSKETLVSAAPRKLSRRSGGWQITWRVADRILSTSTVRAIRPAACHRSIRLVSTRFIVDDGKEITTRRQLPAPGEALRVGPCFFVMSAEPGLAAKCDFEIIATGQGTANIGQWKQTVLVTDGPTPIMPGTISAADLSSLQAFDLRINGRSIGQLPLHPVPVASFTSEGGFQPPPEFPWTPAAEEELNDRLSKLMGG
jgi:hypothetical protein